MTLPLLQVRTAHSDYVIDQNAKTFSRTRREEEANHIGLGSAKLDNGEAYEYEEIASSLEPGDTLLIIVQGGGYLRSTRIESVEEVPVDVAA